MITNVSLCLKNLGLYASSCFVLVILKWLQSTNISERSLNY